MSADLLTSMEQLLGWHMETLVIKAHWNLRFWPTCMPMPMPISRLVMHAIDALALLHWLKAAGGQPHVARRIRQRVWGAIGQLRRRVEDLWTAVPVLVGAA